MKALILAAGMGTRLKPITNSIPKCLVEVNGIPIIFKQIDNLLKNNVKDITVVAGYKADILSNVLNKKYPFVNIVSNDSYETTNNMYSAYLVRDKYIESEFLLMNSDVFFDQSIILELLKDEYINSIVVEKGKFLVESMKVKSDDEQIREISKEISEIDAYGVSIDVYKFSVEGSKVFFNKVIEYIETHGELNHWTEVAINEILSVIKFRPCLIKGRWMEIDTYEDLKYAERIFR